MELLLTFTQGAMTGEGRDFVGPFVVHGQYSLDDGRCHWSKRYLGKHDVYYSGFNEGKGIWGTWEIAPAQNAGITRGGFHIWPEEMSDPTEQHLVEHADVPVAEGELIGVGN